MKLLIMKENLSFEVDTSAFYINSHSRLWKFITLTTNKLKYELKMLIKSTKLSQYLETILMNSK